MLLILLTGFFDQNRATDMIKESVKMHGLEHPHVLSIIGVCVDAGPSPYIVMPFMANGSLLTYIRKEKNKLVRSIDSTDDDLASVFSLIVSKMYILFRGLMFFTVSNSRHS